MLSLRDKQITSSGQVEGCMCDVCVCVGWNSLLSSLHDPSLLPGELCGELKTFLFRQAFLSALFICFCLAPTHSAQ